MGAYMGINCNYGQVLACQVNGYMGSRIYTRLGFLFLANVDILCLRNIGTHAYIYNKSIFI